MKRLIGVLFVSVLLFCVSCSNDDEPIIVPEVEEALITDESGVTVTNTKDIVIGQGQDDVVFEMSSTVLGAGGLKVEKTLNCCAMGALAFDGDKVDSTRSVKNVTLINRGSITVHTKNLVERYAHLIQTPDDTSRAYLYFRVLVMYGGKNCMVINEGKINVYFDHDPSITSTVYVMGLVSGEGSSIVNNGEIHFYGKGSVATRLRGMATFGDNISALNTGTMTADLEMAEDARMITTGGTKSNVINDGIMRMRMPGKVLCMTRYGDSNLINNNTIELTSVDMPVGYASIVGEEDHIICGLYEPLQASRKGMPSLVNRGTISVSIEGSENSVRTQGYGMFCDLMHQKAEELEVNIINDGEINLRQSGPKHFDMAEAGFVARKASALGACSIMMGRWQTKVRDFGQTHDLFLAKGVKMDFSGGKLLLVKDGSYVDGTVCGVKPEDLMYNAASESGMFRYEYTGYENMDIKCKDSNVTLQWDKVNRTVSLTDNK